MPDPFGRGLVSWTLVLVSASERRLRITGYRWITDGRRVRHWAGVPDYGRGSSRAPGGKCKSDCPNSMAFSPNV
eukprot:7247600-Alexandrium_andersonii.AAC.1